MPSVNQIKTAIAENNFFTRCMPFFYLLAKAIPSMYFIDYVLVM
jgi:hypothetical protein